MITLKNVLTELTEKELKRLLKSDKNYFFFDISVFNAGAVVRVKCTDIYKEINRNTWNGYDMIVVNDENTKYFIIHELTTRKSMFQITFSISFGKEGSKVTTKVFRNEQEYEDFVQSYIHDHRNGKIIGESERLLIE